MNADPSSDPSADRAVRFLAPRLPVTPTVGLVLGSGLGPYADRPPTRLAVPYEDIPGFPRCAVEGHAGRLVLADRCGPAVAMLQGRVHRYEGVSLDEATRPVRVLAALGVKTLLVTCAAGSLDGAEPGSLMLIEDHLNLMGDNPLIGRSGAGGARFVEMAAAYDAGLRELASEAAQEAGIVLRRGVLAALTGPTFETAAEAAMLRRLGAQAVSMSVVPEVIAARALGLKVLGLALLTNESGAPLNAGGSHESVLATAGRRADAVGRLLDGILRRLGGEIRP